MSCKPYPHLCTLARPTHSPLSLFPPPAPRPSHGDRLRLAASQPRSLFNNLKEPSQLSASNTYNLFKAGIEPKWEDPQNDAGGEWRVSIPNSRTDTIDVDKYWIDTILTVIGEGFGPDESDDIAGIVLNVKRVQYRIAIWTKTALDERLQDRIGHRWRETASLAARMEYISFKDALGSSQRKPRVRYSID